MRWGKKRQMTEKKYEREIAEILERLERQGQGPIQQAPRRRRESAPRPRPELPTASPERRGGIVWVSLVIGLPLLGFILSRLIPPASLVLVVAGILIFLSPLVTSLLGWRREAPTLWRGRVIEMPYRGSGYLAQLRYYVWRLTLTWDRWRRRPRR